MVFQNFPNFTKYKVSQPDCTSCYTVLMKYILPFWCDLLEELEFKRHKKKHLFTALGDWCQGLFLIGQVRFMTPGITRGFTNWVFKFPSGLYPPGPSRHSQQVLRNRPIHQSPRAVNKCFFLCLLNSNSSSRSHQNGSIYFIRTV